MQYQSFPGGRWVIRFDTGEEFMTGLRDFCSNHNIRGATFTAFGAVKRAKLACFMPDEKGYSRNTVDRQTEVVSLLGNIGWHNNKPIIHAHASLGDGSQTTFSGHLEEAVVTPSLEVFITELGAELAREDDPDTGLKFLKLPETEEKAA